MNRSMIKICALILFYVPVVPSVAADNIFTSLQDGTDIAVPVWNGRPFEVYREPFAELLLLRGQVGDVAVDIYNNSVRDTTILMGYPGEFTADMIEEVLGNDLQRVLVPITTRRTASRYLEVCSVMTVGGKYLFDAVAGGFQVGETMVMFCAILDGCCDDAVFDTFNKWVERANRPVYLPAELVEKVTYLEPAGQEFQPASFSDLTVAPPSWDGIEFSVHTHTDKEIVYKGSAGERAVTARFGASGAPPLSDYWFQYEKRNMANRMTGSTESGTRYSLQPVKLLESREMGGCGWVDRWNDTCTFFGLLRKDSSMFTVTLHGDRLDSEKIYHEGIAWMLQLAEANGITPSDRILFDFRQ